MAQGILTLYFFCSLQLLLPNTGNRLPSLNVYHQVCDVEDILHEVSETTVVLSGSGDEMVVAIPKREQTQSEVERTQQFGQVANPNLATLNWGLCPQLCVSWLSI